MPFKFVLISAIVCQVIATLLALRLNWKYKYYSAWILFSASALLMGIQQTAFLVFVWDKVNGEFITLIPLWTACLSALMVSVLFLGGVALIQPLFIQIARAEAVLQKEKSALEDVVRETEDELRIARDIQQNLLPKTSPCMKGFDVAGASVPAEWTSGDYFDYLPLTGDRSAVVIADVSGHGTGPALLMSAIRSFLRALAHSQVDIGQILTIANRAFCNDVDFGRFVTIFMARFDPPSGQFQFTSAGHEGFLMDHSGQVRTLRSNNPPVGAVADTVFEAQPSETMNCGDILLLISDGIPETESSNGDPFGMERTLEIVRDNRKKPAAEIVASLLDAARTHAGDYPQVDDITAVVLKAEQTT